MKKFLLITLVACPFTSIFAQKSQHGAKPTTIIPQQATPIRILYTDSTARENKQENSWTFTHAKLLLHNSDTLNCDVMICKPDTWQFRGNVRVASPDGLVLHANEMAIDARPKKK